MPKGHDHDAWRLKKDKKNAAWKEKLDLFKVATSRNTPTDESPTNKTKTGQSGKTLALSKNFASALSTKVRLSDAESKAIIDDGMKNADSDNDDASK